MAVMIERDITEALQQATIAAVAASIMPTLPIAIKGRTFETPDDGKWLEMVKVPNNVIGEHWGSEKTYRGLWRLLLHWGIDDAGVYPPLDVIASISGYFAKGSTFSSGAASVKIYEEPDLTGEIEAPPELIFPVTIRYMDFKP